MDIITEDSERIERYPPHFNIHQPLINDFTQAVLEGREPKVNGIIGREVAVIEEMIFKDN